jgi:hypothetical protein
LFRIVCLLRDASSSDVIGLFSLSAFGQTGRRLSLQKGGTTTAIKPPFAKISDTSPDSRQIARGFQQLKRFRHAKTKAGKESAGATEKRYQSVFPRGQVWTGETLPTRSTTD